MILMVVHSNSGVNEQFQEFYFKTTARISQKQLKLSRSYRTQNSYLDFIGLNDAINGIDGQAFGVDAGEEPFELDGNATDVVHFVISRTRGRNARWSEKELATVAKQQFRLLTAAN